MAFRTVPCAPRRWRQTGRCLLTARCCQVPAVKAGPEVRCRMLCYHLRASWGPGGCSPSLFPGSPHGGQAKLPSTSNQSAFSTAQSAVSLDTVPEPPKPLSSWPLEFRHVRGPLELVGLRAGAEIPPQGRHLACHPLTQPPTSVVVFGMSLAK